MTYRLLTVGDLLEVLATPGRYTRGGVMAEVLHRLPHEMYLDDIAYIVYLLATTGDVEQLDPFTERLVCRWSEDQEREGRAPKRERHETRGDAPGHQVQHSAYEGQDDRHEEQDVGQVGLALDDRSKHEP